MIMNQINFYEYWNITINQLMNKEVKISSHFSHRDSKWCQSNISAILFSFASVFVFICLLLINCSDKEGPFVVKVIDTKWRPVIGACIAGGIDWDSFCEYTDYQGGAILPGHARGRGATIIKDNFFPSFIDELEPATYMLASTPRKLKLIGDITGDAIRFESARILTVTYHGEYRVYSYSDDELKEIASAQLPECIRVFKTYGDTLWLSTHEKGFYAYSLQNPMQPQLIYHLNIPGYTIRPFAVKDTFLAVGAWGDFLRLYSFGYDGHYHQISLIDTIEGLNDMTFVSNFLVVINSNNEMPIIYDLGDPSNPQTVYKNSETIYQNGFLYRNYVVLYHCYWYYYAPDTSATYRLIDVSNPLDPLKLGPFSCDAMVTNIVNDTFAIGSYRGAATSVLHGNITSGFSTVAIASGGLCGSLPPYFILGYRLWKLED